MQRTKKAATSVKVSPGKLPRIALYKKPVPDYCTPWEQIAEFAEQLFAKYAMSDTIAPEGLQNIARDLGIDMNRDVPKLQQFVGRDAGPALCVRKQKLRRNQSGRVPCRDQSARY